MYFPKWLALASIVLGACSSDLGEPLQGHSIRGEVLYEGEAAQEYKSPILLVMAETNLSQEEDAPPPYALVTAENVELDQPIPYELRLLLPGRYFVVAIIGERDNFDPITAPRGSFPDSCVLAEMPEERSVQMQEADLEGIDIRVFDALTDDPCFSPAPAPDEAPPEEAPPEADATTGVLEVNITAPDLSAAADDTLEVHLFDESPLVNPDAMAYSETLAGPEFPVTVVFDAVADGAYTVVVCYQTADSTSAQCTGPDDRLAFFPSLADTVSVPAGETTRIDVELN